MTPKNLFITVCATALFSGCGRSPTADPVGDKPVRETEAYKQGKSAASARQSARLKWNRDIRAGAYDKVGRRDPKWDVPARQALDLHARMIADPSTATEASMQQIKDATAQALEAGCDDPLIKYLHTKFVVAGGKTPATEVATAFVSNANALEVSEYGDMIKFFACLRASNALRGAYARTNTPPEWFNLLVSAEQHMKALADDQKTPIDDIYIGTWELLTAAEGMKREFEAYYLELEKPLFKNWPKAAEVYALKGKFYVKYAWHARGGGYADKVTEEGWKLFRERSEEAERALAKAWSLNPGMLAVPEEMIRVSVALQKPRDEMERWFRRAMEIAPNDNEACTLKLWYLSPKWYGSDEEMVKFGRECVASDKWNGSVPLTIVDAHSDIARFLDSPAARKAYWKQPAVWEDIKSGYEKFLKLNPEASAWRNNYAYYAYYCDQWEEFERQVALINPMNYGVFGGQEEFEKMVATAGKNAGKK